MFPFMAGLDPSKMSPELVQKLGTLVQELPPATLSKLQTLMHNQMAGFNISQEIIALESTFPSGFREKMAKLMYEMHAVQSPSPTIVPTEVSPIEVSNESPLMPGNLKEARMTILKAIASGDINPENAYDSLFLDK